MVWTGYRFRWLLVLVPTLMFIAYFSMLNLTHLMCRHFTNLMDAVLSIFGFISHVSMSTFLANTIYTPSIAMALATNMTTTSLISLRLFLQKRHISILGKTYVSSYNFIMEVVVESAAIYTAVTLCLLVSVVLGSNVQDLFVFVFCESAVRHVPSFLFILRLSMPITDDMLSIDSLSSDKI